MRDERHKNLIICHSCAVVSRGRFALRMILCCAIRGRILMLVTVVKKKRCQRFHLSPSQLNFVTTTIKLIRKGQLYGCPLFIYIHPLSAFTLLE